MARQLPRSELDDCDAQFGLHFNIIIINCILLPNYSPRRFAISLFFLFFVWSCVVLFLSCRVLQRSYRVFVCVSPVHALVFCFCDLFLFLHSYSCTAIANQLLSQNSPTAPRSLGFVITVP